MPQGSVHVFVQIAGDDTGGGHCVQNWENANAHHEHLEFISLHAVLAHVFADSEQRDESGYQEGCSDNEVHDVWGDDESHESLWTLVANKAHGGEFIRVHVPHDEDDDGFYGGNGPGGQVEIRRVPLDGFMAPLQSSREKPSEGENHPPDTTRGTEEVQEEEYNGAVRVIQPLLDEHPDSWLAIRVTGDGVAPGYQPHYEPNADDVVAQSQDHNGPFRIPEPGGVDHEREDCEQGGYEAETGPDTHPDVSKVLVPTGEQVIQTAE